MDPLTPPKIIMKVNPSNGKLEETSLQKSKRVTAVTTSPALVVKSNDETFTIWILLTCRLITINRDGSRKYKNFKIGTWLTVGVFPNGYIASFQPAPLLVQFHITKCVGDNIMIHSILSEITTQFRINGLGRVGIRGTLMHTTKKSKESTGVWIQWVENKHRVSLPNRWEWEIVEIDNSVSHQQLQLSEVERRECHEQIRKLKSQEAKNILNIPAGISPVKYVARHYGLITNVEERRNIFWVWSPLLKTNSDHTVMIENELINFSKTDIPIIGQWIMFDTSISDVEKLKNNRSFKFCVSHYLPISSPCGISSCLFADSLRVVLSCVLIRSTDVRYIYEIPDFGLVIDERKSLRSGAFMQVLLERIPEQKRVYEFQWRVLDSAFVTSDIFDLTIKTTSISTTIVPVREAYTLATLISPVTNSSHNSINQFSNNEDIGNSMVFVDSATIYPIQRQPFTPHNGSNIRYNGDIKSNFNQQSDGNFYKKNGNPGQIMEVIGIVEKIEMVRSNGVLWACESHPSGRVIGIQIHFTYSEYFGFDVGETVLARLIQRQDFTIRGGLRWYMEAACRQPPLYKCLTERGHLSITTDARFQMSYDKKGRPMLHANHFSQIIDEMNVFSNELIKMKLNPCPVTMNIVIHRRKIPNCIHDKHNNNYQDVVFCWVVSEVSNVRLLNSPLFTFQHIAHMADILQTYHKDTKSNKLMVDAVRSGYTYSLTDLSRETDERVRENDPLIFYDSLSINV